MFFGIPAGTAALGCLLFALSAPAIEFGEGALEGTLDTTLSHGLTFRIEGREARVNDFRSANSNDGNLNYGRGVVSNTSKVTTDLDLGNRRFGAFLRATGFVDFENENGARARTPLSGEAKDIVGKDFEVLDAYVTGAFEPGGAPVDLRLGRHVLNWGESTFIGGGINAFNRYDVGKLRLPGSELREALAPVSMVSVSAAPSDTLTVEGFYQLEWEETVLDPVGSFFSTNDVAGPGATEVVVNSERFRPLLGAYGSEVDREFGFGRLTPAINADLARSRLPPYRAHEPDFMSVARGPDRLSGDSGQWGVALRHLAEDLNQTELGLYFGRYHSRLPLISARTAGTAAIQAGLAAAGAVGAPGSATSTALAGSVAPEVTREVTARGMAAVAAGTLERAAAPALIERRVTAEVERQVGPRVSGIATALAIDRYAETVDRRGATGHYFLEYPEGIRFFGLSFNTELGASGWTLQGEYTLHIDTPLQRAQDVLVGEGILPISEALELAGCVRAPAEETCDRNPRTGEVLPSAYFARSLSEHIEQHRPDDVVGYARHDVSQVQVTATKAFGPRLGADGLTVASEVAIMRVHGLTQGHRIESPARPRRLSDSEESADADSLSWGYRISARLRYSNAIGAVGLFPFVQWGHDVDGNGPTPIGQFAEGRTALTVGVGADYLKRWQANVGLTMYGGRSDTRYDRDFLSASVKFSF
ncbi:MAG: DUF1302 domain-containing protein [Immundisolibacterales bacterium]|nr:DUF1302 domain-containing protein [Immundisolibacterales bacterium]